MSKKILSGICALALVCVNVSNVYANDSLLSNIGTSSEAIITKYNSSDILAIRRYLLHLDNYKKSYFDVNRDGKVNSTDILKCKRFLLHLETAMDKVILPEDIDVTTQTTINTSTNINICKYPVTEEGVLFGLNGTIVNIDGKVITIEYFRGGYYHDNSLGVTIDLSEFIDEDVPLKLYDTVSIGLEGGSKLVYIQSKEYRWNYVPTEMYPYSVTYEVLDGQIDKEYTFKTYDELISVVGEDNPSFFKYDEEFFQNNVLVSTPINNTQTGYELSVGNCTITGNNVSFNIYKTWKYMSSNDNFNYNIVNTTIPKNGNANYTYKSNIEEIYDFDRTYISDNDLTYQVFDLNSDINVKHNDYVVSSYEAYQQMKENKYNYCPFWNYDVFNLYDEDFFENNLLVLTYLSTGYTGTDKGIYTVSNCNVRNNTVSFDINHYIPIESDVDDNETRLIILTIPKYDNWQNYRYKSNHKVISYTDVSSPFYDEYQNSLTATTILPETITYIKDEDINYKVYPSNSNMYGRNEFVLKSREELEEIYNSGFYNSIFNGNTIMDDYDEQYFNNNILLLKYLKHDNSGYTYDVKDCFLTENDVSINVNVYCPDTINHEYQANIIAIDIPKDEKNIDYIYNIWTNSIAPTDPNNPFYYDFVENVVTTVTTVTTVE